MAQIQITPQFSPKDEESISDLQETPLISRGCCCFWNYSRKSDDWDRISTSDLYVNNRNWLGKGVKALKKVREWSELVAGPKWKTFIRRFNKRPKAAAPPGKFQYDPLRYALNFDEGQVQIGQFEDDDRVLRDFSSRYAAIQGQNGQVREVSLVT